MANKPTKANRTRPAKPAKAGEPAKPCKGCGKADHVAVPRGVLSWLMAHAFMQAAVPPPALDCSDYLECQRQQFAGCNPGDRIIRGEDGTLTCEAP